MCDADHKFLWIWISCRRALHITMLPIEEPACITTGMGYSSTYLLIIFSCTHIHRRSSMRSCYLRFMWSGCQIISIMRLVKAMMWSSIWRVFIEGLFDDELPYIPLVANATLWAPEKRYLQADLDACGDNAYLLSVVNLLTSCTSILWQETSVRWNQRFAGGLCSEVLAFRCRVASWIFIAIMLSDKNS